MTAHDSRLSSVIPFVSAPGLNVRTGISKRSTENAGCRQPGGSYFIATLPRSGSWLLAEVLANTGLAGVPNEYFRSDFTALWSAEWGLPENSPYSAYVQAAKEFTMTPNGVFSAKLHWYQFSWLCRELLGQHGGGLAESPAQRLLEWFPDLRYVFLWRRDTARQAISYYRASVTQEWFMTHDGQKQTPDTAIDFQQIRWFEDILLDHREQWLSFFANNAITPLDVTYEDLTARYETVICEILSFLGISDGKAMTVRAPILRRQSDSQSEAILERYLTIRGSLIPRPLDLFWSEADKRFQSASISRPGASQLGT